MATVFAIFNHPSSNLMLFDAIQINSFVWPVDYVIGDYTGTLYSPNRMN